MKHLQHDKNESDEQIKLNFYAHLYWIYIKRIEGKIEIISIPQRWPRGVNENCETISCKSWTIVELLQCDLSKVIKLIDADVISNATISLSNYLNVKVKTIDKSLIRWILNWPKTSWTVFVKRSNLAVLVDDIVDLFINTENEQKLSRFILWFTHQVACWWWNILSCGSIDNYVCTVSVI